MNNESRKPFDDVEGFIAHYTPRDLVLQQVDNTHDRSPDAEQKIAEFVNDAEYFYYNIGRAVPGSLRHLARIMIRKGWEKNGSR